MSVACTRDSCTYSKNDGLSASAALIIEVCFLLVVLTAAASTIVQIALALAVLGCHHKLRDNIRLRSRKALLQSTLSRDSVLILLCLGHHDLHRT